MTHSSGNWMNDDQRSAVRAASRDAAGYLLKGSNGRWNVIGHDGHDVELSSGSVVEVRVGGIWVKTSIEHNGRHYYATVRGIQLVDEMPARLPKGGA